jgi:formylglycine-generating enzyme required for sulfatase activity
MRFVLVPAGRFFMGSPDDEAGRYDREGPVHEVEITRPFYLGICPVTQAEFAAVTHRNPSFFSPYGPGRQYVAGVDTNCCPVESVSWEDICAFCFRLTDRREERLSRRSYRLPTEAEWEYACRAAGRLTAPFSFGRRLSSRQANFNGKHPNAGAPVGPFLGRTTPVGSYPPNPLGLYDMHGNVWEVCQDRFDRSYYATSPLRDPSGPAGGETCVLRGGCWYSKGRACRSACRAQHLREPKKAVGKGKSSGPSYHDGTIGFRVVLTADAPAG